MPWETSVLNWDIRMHLAATLKIPKSDFKNKNIFVTKQKMRNRKFQDWSSKASFQKGLWLFLPFVLPLSVCPWCLLLLHQVLPSYRGLSKTERKRQIFFLTFVSKVMSPESPSGLTSFHWPELGHMATLTAKEEGDGVSGVLPSVMGWGSRLC